jgi:hypothetical protein
MKVKLDTLPSSHLARLTLRSIDDIWLGARNRAVATRSSHEPRPRHSLCMNSRQCATATCQVLSLTTPKKHGHGLCLQLCTTACRTSNREKRCVAVGMATPLIDQRQPWIELLGQRHREILLIPNRYYKRMSCL